MLKTKKIHKIVLYNKAWAMDEKQDYNYPVIDGFELSTEHKYIDEAAAVIFHMPTIRQGDPILKKDKKKSGQLWVFWSMECEAHYGWQYDPEILGLFDIMGTYKLDSDIPVPYIYPVYLKLLKRKPVRKKALVNAFISSDFDQSKRIPYLRELMSYINVHSYGKILNNQSLSRDKGILTKQKIISRYKFSIAFENAIAKDYVTEKFFDPLIAGSVPVYLGAPNVEELAPADRCYINVHDFPSVRALADYLLDLENDHDRYAEYLAWKKAPLRNGFILKANSLEMNPLVRLCHLLQSKLLS